LLTLETFQFENEVGSGIDSSLQMARDLDLFQKAQRGIACARVYDWVPPWVTLGKFQVPEETLTPFVLKMRPLPYSMRETGGAAVLHGHDLTVCLALPRTRSLASGNISVLEMFRAITHPIISALNACGLKCDLAENHYFDSAGSRMPECFGLKSRNDIISLKTLQKVCGCAQKMTREVIFLQASIPYKEPIVDPSQWIIGASQRLIEPWDISSFADQLVLSLNDNISKSV
jgi:lipoate-protein ligase A